MRVSSIPAERFDYDKVVAVEAPKGSLVVWGGNTWHGAFPRQVPGLRATNVFTYCREYLPADVGEVPQEMIDRNGPRFAELMGKHAFRISRRPAPASPVATAAT